MIMSLFEYLDSACEITVLPQPKAPGIAVVPPCTQLYIIEQKEVEHAKAVLTGIEHPESVDP